MLLALSIIFVFYLSLFVSLFVFFVFFRSVYSCVFVCTSNSMNGPQMLLSLILDK